MAILSGHVQVVQGDLTMKCQTLVVFYGQEVGLNADGTPAAVAKAAPGMPQGAQNIRRIEARGGVTVITKTRIAAILVCMTGNEDHHAERQVVVS